MTAFLQDRKGIPELGWFTLLTQLNNAPAETLWDSPFGFPPSMELKSVSLSMPVILGDFQEVLPVHGSAGGSLMEL